MRMLPTIGRLIARVRVAPSPTRSPAPQRARERQGHRPPEAAPAAHPVLAAQASRFMQIEREVLARFRPQLRDAVQEALEAVAAQQAAGVRPVCCGHTMTPHDHRPVTWLTWVGAVRVPVGRYRCRTCRAERRPLLEHLDVEPGQPSGLLARMLGVLGCVASYSLAAELAGQLLGVTVNAMTVWRAVQRLGEAAARYTEALSAYHAESRSEAPVPAHAPEAVVVAVDGCALGMQVRPTRRHRKTAEEVLPPLPRVDEGHFREVKTGVLVLPPERVQPSPGRH